MVLWVFFAVATMATPPCQPPCRDIPTDIPPGFDCAIRKFALQAASAQQLGPGYGYDLHSVVGDALQLNTRCNHTHAPSLRPPTPPPAPEICPADHVCFYVDPTRGHDKAPGSITKPLRTLEAGLERSRGVGTECTHSTSPVVHY